MINLSELYPDQSYWFHGFFIAACVAVGVALIATCMAFFDHEGRVKSLLFTAGFAVLAGTLALPTFLYEAPKNDEAQAVANEAVADASNRITEAVQERYDVETVTPASDTSESCFLFCEDRTVTLRWTEVVEEAVGVEPSTESTVSVVLKDGQVVDYGLIYDNDTGKATLLKLSDKSPVPGDLMKDS